MRGLQRSEFVSRELGHDRVHQRRDLLHCLAPDDQELHVVAVSTGGAVAGDVDQLRYFFLSERLRLELSHRAPQLDHMVDVTIVDNRLNISSGHAVELDGAVATGGEAMAATDAVLVLNDWSFLARSQR